MTSRELFSALIDCGLPGELVKPKLNGLVRDGIVPRDRVDSEHAIVALLCSMSFRPARDLHGICCSLAAEANADTVARVDLLSRGLFDVHASVYLVDDWRRIETVHCGIVPPVTRAGVQMRRVRGVHVAEIGKRGGWWGASPSPSDPAQLLPGLASDRGPADR